MKLIQYNGVTLEVVRTNLVQRQVVMSDDNTTYLWDKWTVDVYCVYNPRTTSYETSNDPGFGTSRDAAGSPPQFILGNVPGMTDAALRHLLSQPQKTLRLDMGGRDNWLISPLPGSSPVYVTDAAGTGPLPEVGSIIHNFGDHTFLVQFRVTTCVSENPFRLTQTPLISHRWTRYLDTDEDYYATLTTEGEAIFRVDEILRIGAWPDQYRQDLFHPVPPNCQRGPIQVAALPDGSGVRYRFVDYEQPMNFNPSGYEANATRIEAYHTFTYSRAGFLTAVGLNAGSVAAGGVGLVGGIMNILTFQNLEGEINQATQTLQAGLLGLLPRFGSHFLVRVWGNRRSFRANLKNLAMGVITSRIAEWSQSLNLRSTELVFAQDVAGKFVEIRASQSWGNEGFLGSLVSLAGVPGAAATELDPVVRVFFPETDFIGNILSNNVFSTNPGPPSSNSTRGTLLSAIIAQTLSGASVATPDSDYVPPAPPTSIVDTTDLSIDR